MTTTTRHTHFHNALIRGQGITDNFELRTQGDFGQDEMSGEIGLGNEHFAIVIGTNGVAVLTVCDPKDFLFFDGGEVDDNMRDREFILVRGAYTEAQARKRILRYARKTLTANSDAIAYAERQAVFTCGPRLEGFASSADRPFTLIEL